MASRTAKKATDKKMKKTDKNVYNAQGSPEMASVEDETAGMKKGGKKTFQVPFPKDYFEKDLAGKESEFTCTVHEIKQKKLPKLDDELAKTVGFDNVADLKEKAKEQLVSEKKGEVERKFRSDILSALIEKNAFDVPESLVQAQTRTLAQDVAGNLHRAAAGTQRNRAALEAIRAQAAGSFDRDALLSR